MAMTSTVLTRVEDGVATLTLNRPKAMNAFDADDARAIVEATDLFAADPDVRVMVLGGAGRSFSAGGDFNWVLTWPNLDAITRRVGADGRSRGQVMADTLVERTTGRSAAAATPIAVNLVLSDETLMGGSSAPADVNGYGPIPAAVARGLISSAVGDER